MKASGLYPQASYRTQKRLFAFCPITFQVFRTNKCWSASRPMRFAWISLFIGLRTGLPASCPMIRLFFGRLTRFLASCPTGHRTRCSFSFYSPMKAENHRTTCRKSILRPKKDESSDKMQFSRLRPDEDKSAAHDTELKPQTYKWYVIIAV